MKEYTILIPLVNHIQLTRGTYADIFMFYLFIAALRLNILQEVLIKQTSVLFPHIPSMQYMYTERPGCRCTSMAIC